MSMHALPVIHSPAKTLVPSHPDGWGAARRPHGCCPCGRRHLLSSSGAALLPVSPLKPPAATALLSDATDLIERFHPKRPDWYEELFARAMSEGMRSYEAQISGYKEIIFSRLFGSVKNVLELGVGAGPNFKYYAPVGGVKVVGVDPNKQMERYARDAAIAAGIPSSDFSFIRGVGEALPATDNSMDAVIGTLVLCSVKDVHMTLKEVKRVLKPGGAYLFIEHVAAQDGTFLRFLQTSFDPLQQFVADGCHLTRQTGKQISEAGFSSVSLSMAFLSNIQLISPHVYGIACK